MSNVTARYFVFFVLVSSLNGCAAGAADTGGTGGSGAGGTPSTAETGGAGEGGVSSASNGTGAMGGAGGSTETTGEGGGTATTVTTGAGGGTTTTGAGGSGPNLPSACALGCEMLGGTCNEEGCLLSNKTLVASVLESGYTVGGQDVGIANANVRLFPAGTMLPSFTVLGSDGPCAAVTYPGPAAEPPKFDAGTVTILGPQLPTTSLTPPDYSKSLSATPDLFAPGDTLTFTVAGGPDFPGFTAQAVAPEELQLAVPTIQASQPLLIAWSAAAPPSYITIFTSAKGIVCFPDQASALEVPVSLLALIDSPLDVSHAAVTGVRLVSVKANVDAGGGEARVMITKSSSVDVSYEP